MTAIAALVSRDGTVWMGGDSATSLGDNVRHDRDPKVARVGEMLVGYAGSGRAGQVLLHHFKPPERKSGLTDLQYLSGPFVKKLRKLFEDHHEARDVESGDGIHVLVGYRGAVYIFDAGDGLSATSLNYDAIGSGSDVALGALYATAKIAMRPEKRLRLALEAAAEFKTGVAPPFVILSLP